MENKKIKTHRIVITGGPGTGKSTIINELQNRGYNVIEEVSREVIREAKKQGIEQLFTVKPLLFSEKLLEGRERQFFEAAEKYGDATVFFDRGIPDIAAYMNFLGNKYPDFFIKKGIELQYDHVYITPPWEEIYTTDEERYENFQEAQLIHNKLVNMYTMLNYQLTFIPFGTPEKRADYIIETTKLRNRM
jgi:predicted ATPase